MFSPMIIRFQLHQICFIIFNCFFSPLKFCLQPFSDIIYQLFFFLFAPNSYQCFHLQAKPFYSSQPTNRITNKHLFFFLFFSFSVLFAYFFFFLYCFPFNLFHQNFIKTIFFFQNFCKEKKQICLFGSNANIGSYP